MFNQHSFSIPNPYVCFVLFVFHTKEDRGGLRGRRLKGKGTSCRGSFMFMGFVAEERRKVGTDRGWLVRAMKVPTSS